MCIRDSSYGVVREFVGHGIGKEMHEDPQVPNYGKRGYGPVSYTHLDVYKRQP